MKNRFIALALTGILAATVAQAAPGSDADEIASLKKDYQESLSKLLEKYIEEENVAAVKEVCVELDRVRPRPTKVDPASPPPAGVWQWFQNAIVTIQPDGLAYGGDQNYAVWKWTDKEERKGQISWANGYIDTFTVSPDGRTLHLVNNHDAKFLGRKVETAP